MTYKVIMHIPYTRVDVVNTQLGMIGYDIRDQYGNQKNEAIFDEDIGFDNGFYMSIYAMPNEDKKTGCGDRSLRRRRLLMRQRRASQDGYRRHIRVFVQRR
jgi:hypothetical protein